MKLGIESDAIRGGDASAEPIERGRFRNDLRRRHGGGETVSKRRKRKCGQRCVSQ